MKFDYVCAIICARLGDQFVVYIWQKSFCALSKGFETENIRRLLSYRVHARTNTYYDYTIIVIQPAKGTFSLSHPIIIIYCYMATHVTFPSINLMHSHPYMCLIL